VLHVGLDLTRRQLDVCVLSDEGELAEELAASPDPEGLHIWFQSSRVTASPCGR
jgi:hypothetical protein